MSFNNVNVEYCRVGVIANLVICYFVRSRLNFVLSKDNLERISIFKNIVRKQKSRKLLKLKRISKMYLIININNHNHGFNYVLAHSPSINPSVAS